MTRVYLSGPMTGIPEQNYPAFNDAARRLREMGLRVENPAENKPPRCGTWLGFMRLALRQMSRVDCVVMLPGWQRSRGGRCEHRIARDLGLQLWTLAEVLREGRR